MNVVVFTGGSILTMGKIMRTQAVTIAEGRIRYVGNLDECRIAAGNSYQEIDLGGRCLMPGFLDVHTHLPLFGQSQSMANLGAPHIKCIADLVKELKVHSSKTPPDAPIQGFGFDQNKFADGRFPTASDLDQVASDRPVFIVQQSGHSGVANTFLLKDADIGPGTPDPLGGTLGRDKLGHPNGVLLEQALSLVRGKAVDVGNHGPDFRFPDSLDNMVKHVSSASKSYLAAGITTIVDAQVTKLEMEAYLAARAAGVLNLRVVMMYLSSYLDDLVNLGLRGTFGDEYLSIGPLKLYADGATTARAAYFTEPYVDDPDNFGCLFHDPEELKELIIKAHSYGLQTATHAIGDAAIDIVLDGIEAAQKTVRRIDLRHRIEHLTFPREDQFARIQKLGVWPVVQPRFIHAIGDSYVHLLGKERASRVMPLGRYRQLGIPLVLSSDSPVADYRPLLGIASAVNRRTASGDILGPEQSISVEDGLKGYTINAAASLHREQEVGSIENGKLADFIVLSENPLDVSPDTIQDILVMETWVAGEPVYRKGIYEGENGIG